MAVAAEVDGHAVEERREVRAVIEIEAAQEELIGLADAGVLSRDQARDALEQLADAADRPEAQVGLADPPLRPCRGEADLLGRSAEDDDFFDRTVLAG